MREKIDGAEIKVSLGKGMQHVFVPAQSSRVLSHFPDGQVEEDGTKIENHGAHGVCNRHAALKKIISSLGRAQGKKDTRVE